MSNNNSKMPSVNSLVKDYSLSAAVITKLNAKPGGSRKLEQMDVGNSTNIMLDNFNRTSGNEDILKLFPEVEMSIQILSSSILSPNDMQKSNLTFKYPDGINIPSSVSSTILTVIGDYLEETYGLQSMQHEIIRKYLFLKGAYIEAVIPEVTIDDIINGNMSAEKYADNKIDNKGIFGPSAKINYLNASNVNAGDVSIGAESADKIALPETDAFCTTFMVDFTDNKDILAAPQLELDAIEKKLDKLYNNEALSFGAEDRSEYDSLFISNSGLKQEGILLIKDDKSGSRKSIGKPLVMELPTEAVVPIYPTGNPAKHIGYLLILDENGNPINLVTNFQQQNNNMDNILATQVMTENATAPNTINTQYSQKHTMLKNAASALYGQTKKEPTLLELDEVYNELIDMTIKSKLKSGILGTLAEIEKNSDVYRVMFTRALAAKKTRILFVPASNIVYYANKFRNNGTGKSMLEEVQMLYSIRAILLFSKVMTMVKNSTTITKYDVTLDDDDLEPEVTAEKIVSENLRSKQISLPIGFMKIDDLSSWVKRAGDVYNFKHKALPNMTVDLSYSSPQTQVPDNELDETLKNNIMHTFGLDPEIIETGFKADFATTVVAKNLLFAKRIGQYQLTHERLLTDHVRKLLTNDGVIKEMVRDVISQNIKDVKKAITAISKSNPNANESLLEHKDKQDNLIDYLTTLFLTKTYVTLPRPEVTDATGLKTAYDAYKESLNDYLDNILDDEMLTDSNVGNVSEKIAPVKKIIKAVLLKRWVDSNKYIPDFTDILTTGIDGRPNLDVVNEYSDVLLKLGITAAEATDVLAKFKTETDSKINEINEANNVDQYNDPQEVEPTSDEENVMGDEPITDEDGAVNADTAESGGVEETAETDEMTEVTGDETITDVEEETKKDDGVTSDSTFEYKSL